MKQDQHAEQNHDSQRNRFQSCPPGDHAEYSRDGSGSDHRGPDLESYGVR